MRWLVKLSARRKMDKSNNLLKLGKKKVLKTNFQRILAESAILLLKRKKKM